jgi:hypothetical protein
MSDKLSAAEVNNPGVVCTNDIPLPPCKYRQS